MGGSAPTIVPDEDVYRFTQIIDRELGGGFDHCVCRVDRDVTGRNPVPIMRDTPPAIGTPMVVIGHPVVLPKKIAGGAEVKSINSPDSFFDSNLDTYGGNSGSMVVNLDTYEVCGILVRGAPDFTSGGGCTQSNQLPDTNGSYEECSLTMRFQDVIPELGLAVSPAGTTTHIAPVGGPFDVTSVVYTLSNPTGDPIDYQVSLDMPGGQLLLNGGASPVSGTLGAGADTTVTVSLAGSATSLPAGVIMETVTFDDITNARQLEREHVIEVGQSFVSVTPTNDLFGGGPLGGPFSATQQYTVTNLRPTPAQVQISTSETWVSVDGNPAGTTINLPANGSSQIVTVGFAPDANALPNGLHQTTLDFDNLTSGALAAQRTVTLDVGRFAYQPGDLPLNISDNSTVVSQISVADDFCVADVDVEIDITHTYIGDLRVILTAPDGTNVTLHDRTGGSADNLVRTYDDDGMGQPADGPGSLMGLEDVRSVGTWTLTVSDNAGGDTGSLNQWTLKIASSGSVCPPDAFDRNVTLFANGTAFFGVDPTPVRGLRTTTVETLPLRGRLYQQNGTAIVSAPHTLPAGEHELYYNPETDYVGADSFTYSIEQGGIDSNVATVDISIGGEAAFHEAMIDDSDPAWTTQGDWAFGSPSASGGPGSGFTGANCYAYNLTGDYPDNLPAQRLTTHAFDCSDLSNARLEYRRWLAIESSSYDQARIEISNNGSSWTTLWSHSGGTFNDDAWVLRSFDVSAVADGQSSVFVRWTMGPTDGSVNYAGWHIDDLRIIADAPFVCAADVTTTGSMAGEPAYGSPDAQVDLSDLLYFVNDWTDFEVPADMTTTGAGAGDPGYGMPDGTIDLSDLLFFVNKWQAPCP